MGPVGADIFCREAQVVWGVLRPYLDEKVLAGASRVGLPVDRGKLAALGGDDVGVLAAALVRVSLDDGLARDIAS